MLLLAATADPSTSEALWALAQALADVRAAGAALDDAAGDLFVLSRDTEWRSDGVTALCDALGDLTTRTRVAAADAGVHEARIMSVMS
ncbi:hypothetical protein [Microbacterium sp. 1.5R]|uniref:hypothetical protein n=1 Tax=Microbacterium sp. 1.5R TaxID=1916917 RepID=UPI0011A2143B|nr:hypothetical protein [Microbacterium sp. 1.5R]